MEIDRFPISETCEAGGGGQTIVNGRGELKYGVRGDVSR